MNPYQTYKEYADLINDQSKHHVTLHDLLEFKVDPAHAIPLEEVGSAKEIVKHLATDVMPLGSTSTEAHTTLAVAMNRIGDRSNTSEGDEDEHCYRNELYSTPIRRGTKLSDMIGREVIEHDLELQEGDLLRSRIKQVASDCFDVAAGHLASADQIWIRMMQSAKLDEGGQLPSHKMMNYIGKLRYVVPGVGLVSPPPHHGIYSIEDLAQLVHDLKDVNPHLDVSIKLVSETDMDTVAAGIAEAKADHVVIAGHNGGVDISP